jgi:DtxR family Mn-dependent transcriptional regulator
MVSHKIIFRCAKGFFRMSESEEMYMVTIAMLQESGAEKPIPLSHLASELSIQPVSANQMIKKLEDEGLVSYIPYKGVALTPGGEQLAMRILRHRRLWEVFLVQYLDIPLLQANELACRMEHILPKEAAERLADFLDDPQTNPQGLPIPAAKPGETWQPDRSLLELQTGECGQVTRLPSGETTHQFLTQQGLAPGASLTLLATGQDGTRLLSVGTNQISLAQAVAGDIWIKLERPRP